MDLEPINCYYLPPNVPNAQLETVSIAPISRGTQVSYPSKVFAQKNFEKPNIALPKVGNGTIDQIAENLLNKLTNGDAIQINSILIYLRLSARRLERSLDEDWKSYSVDIGKKGSMVSPLSLVKVIDTDSPFGAAQIQLNDHNRLLLLLLSINRVLFAYSFNQVNYTQQVLDAITKISNHSDFQGKPNNFKDKLEQLVNSGTGLESEELKIIIKEKLNFKDLFRRTFLL